MAGLLGLVGIAMRMESERQGSGVGMILALRSEIFLEKAGQSYRFNSGLPSRESLVTPWSLQAGIISPSTSNPHRQSSDAIHAQPACANWGFLCPKSGFAGWIL